MITLEYLKKLVDKKRKNPKFKVGKRQEALILRYLEHCFSMLEKPCPPKVKDFRVSRFGEALRLSRFLGIKFKIPKRLSIEV